MLPDQLNFQREKVTLLFKPGHYDILYPREYLNVSPQIATYDREFISIFDPTSGRKGYGNGNPYSGANPGFGAPQFPPGNDPYSNANFNVPPNYGSYEFSADGAIPPLSINEPIPPPPRNLNPYSNLDFNAGP